MQSTPLGQKINIGDNLALHARDLGTGAPTVVFEPALGGFALQWAAVQEQVADLTRTIIYDRAGQGWSDASPQPRTPTQLTDELHALLHKLDAPPPYVLVAHSFGGLLARVFAERFADEVAGVVLVDASHERQYEPIAHFDRLRKVMGVAVRGLSLLSYVGLGQTIARRSLKSLRGDIDAARWAEMVELAGGANHHETLRREFAEYPRYFGPASEVPPSLGNTPLVVVTAGDSLRDQRPIGGYTAAQLNTMHQSLQRELTALSTDSRHMVVEGATHLDILAKPLHVEQVSGAVGEIIERVRTDKRG